MGSSAYELLQKNLPEGIPSLSTTQREAYKCFSPLNEGVFMFDQWSAYLDMHNAPRIVSISEDATRVITRVEYDSYSNKIVGFVLPLDDNSLPKINSFVATSFEVIETMFGSSNKASYAYIYMAQPMVLNVPPFCLALLGTDNHFDAKAVIQRWKYIVKECANRKIEVISFGSDGDSRLLTAMLISSKLYDYSSKQLSDLIITDDKISSYSTPFQIRSAWDTWFSVKNVTSISYMQDIVHLGVKLKARLLTHSQILPMGKYSAISSHLTILQSSFRKEQHNLRLKDLSHQDRQNFEAVL